MLVVDDSDAILFAFGEANFLSALGAIGTCSIFVPSCLIPETNAGHQAPAREAPQEPNGDAVGRQ